MIVQALDRIPYLIGKQGIFIKRHRKQFQTATPCEIQEISRLLFGKQNTPIFYFMSKFVQYYEKTSSIPVQQVKLN